MKKELTNTSKGRYAESLKRKTRLSPPSVLVIFLYLSKWRMIAGNILNTGRACLFYGFSESATSQICVAFLKKVKQMTNTIIEQISQLRFSLNELYANTSSQSLALECSAVRRVLATLAVDILDEDAVNNISAAE